MIADRAMTSRIGEGGTHSVVRERGLAAHVHDHALGTDRVRTEQGPLEELVRIALEELTIFEGARLGLVAVDDHEGRPLGSEEIPLLRGGERAPAAPPGEAGSADLGEHLGRGHVGDGSAQGGVPVGHQIAGEGVRTRVVHASEEDVRRCHEPLPGHPATL